MEKSKFSIETMHASIIYFTMLAVEILCLKSIYNGDCSTY